MLLYQQQGFAGPEMWYHLGCTKEVQQEKWCISFILML